MTTTTKLNPTDAEIESEKIYGFRPGVWPSEGGRDRRVAYLVGEGRVLGQVYYSNGDGCGPQDVVQMNSGELVMCCRYTDGHLYAISHYPAPIEHVVRALSMPGKKITIGASEWVKTR